MKRILQLSITVLASITVSAQILESDNFDSYIPGNLGTSANGSIAGQGGMFTNGGNNQDYQIVSIDSAHGNSLQIITDNGNTSASNRIVEKQGLGAAWVNRLSGNNILKGSLAINTGTSPGPLGSSTYPQSTISDASGIIVGIYYSASQRAIKGYASLTDTGTGSRQAFTIDIPAGNNLQDNTWINVYYTYDPQNGVITYNVNGTMHQNFYIPGNLEITKNLQPVKHNLSIIAAPANTAQQTAAFDNVVIEAISSTSLAVADNSHKTESISIYPNPTTDYLNISTQSQINNVEIFDLSGKKMTAFLHNGRVNIEHLAAGNYFITITTSKEKISKQFIKENN